MTLPVYVINLDRAADRWARVSARLAALGMTAHRIPAWDAQTQRAELLSLRGLHDGPVLRLSTADGRAYSAPEEGCFQSHLKALRAFLDSAAQHGVIAEDDIIPGPDFSIFTSQIAGIAGLEVVKLEAAIWRGARPAIPVARLGGRALVASMRASSGSACYLVSRRGARKLLRAAPRHFCAYDEFLCSVSAHGAQVLDAAPMAVEQEKQDTEIHNPHLAHFRPLSRRARAGFAAKRLWRRARRVWMALAAGRFAVWRIVRAPWWAP